MFQFLKNFFSKNNKSKVQRLSDEDIRLIEIFHDSNTPPDNIATAMSLSLSRVNYEIKQIESKRELERSQKQNKN